MGQYNTVYNIFYHLFYRYVTSWIDTREVQSEKANLQILFDKYIPMCLDTMRTRFKKITPVAEISQIQMLCYLLECLLTAENTPPDCPKELYELYFVFASVWAFGGVTFQDQVKSLFCFIVETLPHVHIFYVLCLDIKCSPYVRV